MKKHIDHEELIALAIESLEALLERGHFANGDMFRPTQRDAFASRLQHLKRADLSTQDRLSYFWEIPMGVGKTAAFLGLIEEMYKRSVAKGHNLSFVVVVPLVNLLRQAEKEVKKYAPSLANKISFYGDGKHDLSQPLKYITYSAFVDLITTDRLQPDVLVSDEGHRGTSLNRANIINTWFRGRGLGLAVTATGKFNIAKTIMLTHGMEGFSRSLGESVQLGELSAYVQSQLHIIRVKPTEDSLKAETGEAQRKEQRLLNYKRKKKAWTKSVAHILAEGKDEQTGDPLYDNLSAFYVADIDHANDTEFALNDYPKLQDIAKQQGRKGVAVAIHTRMSPKERSRRLDAFARGEYMAIIGDGMFKEGYDNKFVKNIFDYPRLSIVDKTQIAGRALRQLIHPRKARFEGSTIIDTVVYIGSEDPKADLILRNEALLGTTRARDVLGGNVIYGPGQYEAVSKRLVSHDTRHDFGDIEVESATTLASIDTIFAGIESLRHVLVRLDEVVDETGMTRYDIILDYYAKTNIASRQLFSDIQEIDLKPPEDLTFGILRYAINPGSLTRHIRREHYDFIIAAYKELLARKMNFVTLDVAEEEGKDTVRERLVKLAHRAQLGARKIYNELLAADAVPQGLTPHIINGIIRVRTNYKKKSNVTRKAFCDAIEELCSSRQKQAPEARIKLDVVDHATGMSPREHLRDLKRRSGGIGSKTILDLMEAKPEVYGEVPPKLKWQMIDQAILGTVYKTLPESYYRAIVKAYEACQIPGEMIFPNKVDESLGITPREYLCQLREQTIGRGLIRTKPIGPEPIFELIENDCRRAGVELPANLTVKAVFKYLYSDTTNAPMPKVHFDLMVRVLKQVVSGEVVIDKQKPQSPDGSILLNAPHEECKNLSPREYLNKLRNQGVDTSGKLRSYGHIALFKHVMRSADHADGFEGFTLNALFQYLYSSAKGSTIPLVHLHVLTRALNEMNGLCNTRPGAPSHPTTQQPHRIPTV
jgi:superfamily II DNA or RNA helicase